MNSQYKKRANTLQVLSALAFVSIPNLAQAQENEESQNNKNTIVITTKANATEANLANSISIITAEEIKNSGATNLQDILKTVSGFNFTVNSSSISGRKNIGLRGLDSEHILFLIDGERVSTSDAFIGHSNFQSSWVTLDNIQKIEIVKGSGSILYGSEAIGGVINVITKSGSQQDFAQLKTSASSLPNRDGGEGRNASISAGRSLTDLLYLSASFSYSKRASADPYTEIVSTAFGDFESSGVDFEESIVKNSEIGLSYKLTEETELTFSITNSDEERNLLAPYYGIERDRYKIGLNSQFGKWDVNLKAYSNESSFAWNAFGQSPYYTHVIEDEVVSAEMQGQLTDSQYLTFGIESHSVDYFKDYSDPESTRDYRATGTKQTSFYVQDNITFDKDSLNLGLRVDDNSQFGSGYSPAVAYVHSLDDGLALTASYTVAFLTPNIKEADDNYIFNSFGHVSFLGNSDLKPETSRNIEFGLKKRSKNFDWSLSVYQNEIDDMISLLPISASELTYANIANATIEGLEVTLYSELSESFVLNGSYNYLDSDDGEGNELPYRSNHNAKTNVTHNYDSWTSVVSLSYVGGSSYNTTDESQNPIMVDVASYVTLDLAINKQFTESIKGQIAINNLIDETLDSVDDEYFTELLGREYKISVSMSF